MQAATFSGIVDNIVNILRPLVGLLIGVALIYFVWGVITFISSAGDEGKRAEGKQVMTWGIIALFVMLSFWSIAGLISRSLDLEDKGAVNSGFVQ